MEVYILADIQSDDYWEETLQGAKDFLINNWADTDTDSDEAQMTAEELETFLEEIQAADKERLDEMLQGIGYTLFDNIEDMKEFREGDN
jgi:hypothetical protein